MAKYYPMMMNIEQQPALVVGGGPIAARKAATLADYGARVRIVAPHFSDEALRIANESGLEVVQRPFEDADLDTPVLVFAATDDQELHHHIKAECDRRRIPCNIVDVTPLCSFIVPSIIRRGELMITISTDGLCPAYSKYQRKRLEQCCFGPGAERMLHVVTAAREELKAGLGHGMSDEEKFEALREVIESDLPLVIESHGEGYAAEEAVRRIRQIVARRHAEIQNTED
jgi:precorrin-2 dehydrogenase/sirohydrochlorin ferrochelatase